MTTRRTIIIVAAVATVALVAGGFAWMSGRVGSTQVAGAAQTGKPAGQVIELIPVELHTISPRGLVDTVRFTGTTQPVDQTIVKARVPGRLAEVLVREGDKVTKGQVLARFEEAELQSKVNERRSPHGLDVAAHGHRRRRIAPHLWSA